jgi:hypothetical protein
LTEGRGIGDTGFAGFEESLSTRYNG